MVTRVLHLCCPQLGRRWDANYEAVDLADVPHRRLTKPVKVFEHFFDGERKGRSRWAAA